MQKSQNTLTDPAQGQRLIALYQALVIRPKFELSSYGPFLGRLGGFDSRGSLTAISSDLACGIRGTLVAKVQDCLKGLLRSAKTC